MARTQRPPFLGAENPLQVRGGGGRNAGAQAIAKEGGSIIFTKATPPPRGIRCLAGSLHGRSYDYQTQTTLSFLVDLAALASSCTNNNTARYMQFVHTFIGDTASIPTSSHNAVK
jgi:hypothetical protein